MRTTLTQMEGSWVSAQSVQSDTLTYNQAPDDGYFALIERWAAQEHA